MEPGQHHRRTKVEPEATQTDLTATDQELAQWRRKVAGDVSRMLPYANPGFTELGAVAIIEPEEDPQDP